MKTEAACGQSPGSVLGSWNCSTFPVWLWTSHVSQSPQSWGQATGAPKSGVCLAKHGFRSLGFDIQGCFFKKSLVHMSQVPQPYGIPGESWISGQLFICEFRSVHFIKLSRWALISLSIPSTRSTIPSLQAFQRLIRKPSYPREIQN